MFPFLLKQHLQNTRADEELDWVSLPDGVVSRVQDDPNPPLFACQVCLGVETPPLPPS
ncbi:unnamed protein product, partial [Hapterophycus canaliculatus]